MNTIEIQFYNTKIGELILGSFEGKLCLMDYRYRRMRKTIDNRIKAGLNANYIEIDNDLLIQTRTQIDEYLNGIRKEFNIPILMVGSNFQKSVWNELMNIKYGEIVTYNDLAERIGNKKAVRAVAAANGANAIAIIIPCHRIIGSDGKLTGYAGGISVKRRLLNLENDHINLNETYRNDPNVVQQKIDFTFD